MLCKNCQRLVTSDEIGLNLKLISRECTAFLCKSCLAEYFSVSEEILDKKIRQFKRQGCLLFTSPESCAPASHEE